MSGRLCVSGVLEHEDEASIPNAQMRAKRQVGSGFSAGLTWADCVVVLPGIAPDMRGYD